MKIVDSTVLACVLLLAASSSFAQSNDILVQQFFIKREKPYSFVEQTSQEKEHVWEIKIKDPASPQGKALITTVASYFGVPESSVGIALTATFEQGKTGGAAYYINVPSPNGYTICNAMPVEDGYHGVESSQDSTFNAVIRRPVRASQFDGLATYLVVPTKTHTTRSMSTFNVTFVKNPPGWQHYPQCRPTGEAAWLSRNNNTRLNVPCPQRDLCPKPEAGAPTTTSPASRTVSKAHLPRAGR